MGRGESGPNYRNYFEIVHIYISFTVNIYIILVDTINIANYFLIQFTLHLFFY